MTTGATPISSMEDILRALDEHPEWVDAFRTRILGERMAALLDNTAEILQSINDRLTRVEEGQLELAKAHQELAATVAALTERVDALTATVAALTERVDALTATVAALTERVDTLTERVDALTVTVAALTERVDTLTERVDALTERVADLAATVRDLVVSVQALTVRMDESERRAARDFGVLKGYMMKTVAREEADNIADVLGLRYVATLPVSALRNMTDNSGDTSDIAPGDLISFRRADLIAQAVDANGDICYIAAEASFVVGKRDTDRAVRNAGFLTRFTSKPAYPAVAGVSLHESIQQLVISGKVPWYAISEDELTGG